jgi:hypothetical protein
MVTPMTLRTGMISHRKALTSYHNHCEMRASFIMVSRQQQ